MADRGPVASWVWNAGSALVGIVSGAVLVTLSHAETKTVANRADVRGEDHETRIRKLEEQAADVRVMRLQIDEMRTDIKTLLQRTVPK